MLYMGTFYSFQELSFLEGITVERVFCYILPAAGQLPAPRGDMSRGDRLWRRQFSPILGLDKTSTLPVISKM